MTSTVLSRLQTMMFFGAGAAVLLGGCGETETVSPEPDVELLEAWRRLNQPAGRVGAEEEVPPKTTELDTPQGKVPDLEQKISQIEQELDALKVQLEEARREGQP
jgi:hypothetical protein